MQRVGPKNRDPSLEAGGLSQAARLLLGLHRLQPQPGDLVDLVKRLAEFHRLVVADPALEGRQNVSPLQATHSDDERKSEPGVIRRIQLLEARELQRRALIEPG